MTDLGRMAVAAGTTVQMVFAAAVTGGLLTACAPGHTSFPRGQEALYTAYLVWYKKGEEDSGQRGGITANGAVKEHKKVVQKVSHHIQEQSERVRGMYNDMQEQFLKNGLNLELISETRKGFRGTDAIVTSSPGKTPITPRVYAEDYPGGPLPWTAVRLLVLPLERSHKLSSAAESVTREILKKLPFVKDVFRNQREDYHITIWHTSKPMYPCPDAMHSTGGVEPSCPANERQAPTAEYLEKERKWCKNTVASMPAPVLAFERFIFTETGTLLMTWTDQSGQVEELRKKCKAKFPGSVHIKQSNILHTSMLRLLSTQPLDDYIREKIVETCDKWTEKLKGDLWETEKIWYVLESEFSTLAGTREDMPFKQ